MMLNMNEVRFDENSPSKIAQEDLFKLVQYVQNEILEKIGQPYLKYVDRMRIKILFDTLKLQDEQWVPWFLGIKRKTSLDYLTSIQEKCYDRRYEYKKMAPYFKAKRVLDVGCKYWDFSLYVEWSYTGIDIDKVALEEAEKIWRGDFIYWNFFDFPIGQKYDIVCLSHILEHYKKDDCLQMLEKAFQHSEKCFVSIPQWFTRGKWHQQDWDSRKEFEQMISKHYSYKRLPDTEVFSFNYLLTKKHD